jgi:O-methyltransferase
MIKTVIHKTFRLFGLDIVHYPPRDQATPPDFRKDELEILRQVRPWTMTSPDRVYALIQSVRYLSANNIPGAMMKDLDYTGTKASQVLREIPGDRCDDAPLEQVKEVLYGTGYPKEKIHFIRGRVEETIPSSAPPAISLLRLDTDWYDSTKHELVHLFPRLSRAGVVLIDDYGHWQGSRQATDEYFAQNRIPILLNRIDCSGRIALKP